jgi:hypothetical protein
MKKGVVFAVIVVIAISALYLSNLKKISSENANKVSTTEKTEESEETKVENSPQEFVGQKPKKNKKGEHIYVLTQIQDVNWNNGVSKNAPTSFFLRNNKYVARDFVVGSVVEFSDGDKRNVTKTFFNGTDLIITLDGELLDGDKVGYPNKIKVSNPNKN